MSLQGSSSTKCSLFFVRLKRNIAFCCILFFYAHCILAYMEATRLINVYSFFMGFSEKKRFSFFSYSVYFPCWGLQKKKCKLRLYIEVLLLDRAKMTTHFNPSGNALCSQSQPTLWIEMSSYCLLFTWPVLDSVSNIIPTVQSVSAPLRCLSSTLCTFYSIRMDPLTKTCFCGLVIKAIQSSKYKAYSIQHFYWMTEVWDDVWRVRGCFFT